MTECSIYMKMSLEGTMFKETWTSTPAYDEFLEDFETFRRSFLEVLAILDNYYLKCAYSRRSTV